MIKVCNWSDLELKKLSHSLPVMVSYGVLIDKIDSRADSRFVPSQWETALLCNDISHWLGANLESALDYDKLKLNSTIISSSYEKCYC